MSAAPLPEFDSAELLHTFVLEAEENLSRLEEDLLRLEHNLDDRELLNDIFRAAHTLKGGASCVGFNGLAALTHSVEELLDRLRSGETDVTPAIVSHLLEVVDGLRSVLAAVTNAPTARGGSASGDGASTIRVASSKLDQMLDLTGEIAIARGHVRQLITDQADRERIFDSIRDLDQLSTDLQEAVMGVRLVPIGPALRYVHRTVRDLAASEQKLITVSIEGQDVELDMTLLEHLKDPLTHMIRNAVDHGIEPPDVRRAAGKPAEGHLRISVTRDCAGIAVRVSDDGRGLDEQKIMARARAFGMEADGLTREEIQSLIFEPGFSTADSVTDVSGRGVGMDVVRRNVEALRGSVTVESIAGAGTTITIRLPLTLALIEGFAVGIGDDTYILPIDGVLECVDVQPEISRDCLFGVMDLRGQALPCVRLRRLFGLDAAGAIRESVVVVQHEKSRAGIIVDGLYGSHQTVLKPLTGFIRNVPGIGGSSILGSGRVALIIDVAELLRLVFAVATEPSSPGGAGPADKNQPGGNQCSRK